MIISELIAELQRRLAKHGDIEVITTWETTDHEVEPSNIYVRDEKEDGFVLVIDADDNNYKRKNWGVPDDEFTDKDPSHE